ncbi:hypothetical protein EDD85DRAFT_234216 [Armillaria nabsnona]|nr:hypothetical protein EDD85DRAFT_234216 [Armillaria nabsnona]
MYPVKCLYSARRTQSCDHNGMSLHGHSTWLAMSGLWTRPFLIGTLRRYTHHTHTPPYYPGSRLFVAPFSSIHIASLSASYPQSVSKKGILLLSSIDGKESCHVSLHLSFPLCNSIVRRVNSDRTTHFSPSLFSARETFALTVMGILTSRYGSFFFMFSSDSESEARELSSAPLPRFRLRIIHANAFSLTL